MLLSKCNIFLLCFGVILKFYHAGIIVIIEHFNEVIFYTDVIKTASGSWRVV